MQNRFDLDRLIIDTFTTESGVKLLAAWKESLIMSPVVQEGGDFMSWGIREGMNRFVRNIIITLNKKEQLDE